MDRTFLFVFPRVWVKNLYEIFFVKETRIMKIGKLYTTEEVMGMDLPTLSAAMREWDLDPNDLKTYKSFDHMKEALINQVGLGKAEQEQILANLEAERKAAEAKVELRKLSVQKFLEGTPHSVAELQAFVEELLEPTIKMEDRVNFFLTAFARTLPGMLDLTVEKAVSPTLKDNKHVSIKLDQPPTTGVSQLEIWARRLTHLDEPWSVTSKAIVEEKKK
jgi:hypothetical protein